MDIGGTKVRAALVDENGKIEGKPMEVPTGAKRPAEEIFKDMCKLLHDVLDQCNGETVAGIGIGSTGPIDNARGIILEVDNLPTMNGFHMKDRLEEEFGLPVVMDNDANAYILGETLYGAGRGLSSVVGLTLGTGLGCAYVENGRILHGRTDCAGEIGVSPYRDKTIEDYVSGTGIQKEYLKLTGREMKGRDIADEARNGGDAAMAVWDDFAISLAHALSWCANLFDPDIIILGGSLIKSADLYLEKTDKLFRKHISRPLVDTLPLVLAELGENSGVLGAAALIDIPEQ